MKLNHAYKKRGVEGIQKNTLRGIELAETKAGAKFDYAPLCCEIFCIVPLERSYEYFYWVCNKKKNPINTYPTATHIASIFKD